MASVPDILVTTADSRILLVVEAKFNARELADIEPPLKRYMVKMGAPVGLLVTPKVLGIYRNKYTGTSEKSVERIKLVDIPESWPGFSRFQNLSPEKRSDQSLSNLALDFEEQVQSWLERLQTSGFLQHLSPEALDVVSDYIVPVLNEGTVRAAHPREYSSER